MMKTILQFYWWSLFHGACHTRHQTTYLPFALETSTYAIINFPTPFARLILVLL